MLWAFNPFVHKIETDSTTNTKKEMSAYEIMLRCIKKVDVYHKDGSWFLPLCRYEEDNYMRLPALSKKEKHRQRKSMTTVTSVGKELTYFGSNNFFNEGTTKADTMPCTPQNCQCYGQGYKDLILQRTLHFLK